MHPTQVASLGTQYELVPAIGSETTVQLVQYAVSQGGCDFVLAHPDLVLAPSPNGTLVQRLR